MSRKVLVAGASSGIGLATARAFAELGDTVHGAARREISDPRLTGHRVDVTDRAAVRALAEEIGALDALIVTAGVNVKARRFDELTHESWDAIVAASLTGAWNLVHAFREPLLESGGTIVLVSSVSAAWPDRSGAAYQAAKAGVLAFARAIAFEAQGRLRATAILPGVVDTEILDTRPEPPGAATRAQMLHPEDVAAACVFAVGLPPRAYVPELTILPTALQALGNTA